LAVDQLALQTETLISKIYKDLGGEILPSENGATVTSLNISSSFNAAVNISHLLQGNVKTGNTIFNLSSSKSKNAIVVDDETRSEKVTGINKDVSSIIFLHACSKEAVNDKAYGMIYNFDDTAEPLGWYEVVYEDGLVETIPIRYGVNILDWQWRQRIMHTEKEKGKYSQNKYAYNATAVNCSGDSSITFFSFEWKNPRFGKKIKEVNLHSINYKTKNGNSIILVAVSVAENKEITKAKGTEAQ